jgi:hypothetical protein
MMGTPNSDGSELDYLSFVWFGVSAAGYGITFFLPLIVHSLTEITPFKTGLLSALPPTAAMFGLVVFSYIRSVRGAPLALRPLPAGRYGRLCGRGVG